MEYIILLAASGNDVVDTSMRGIARIYETALPNRIRGYYLLGGCADGSRVSDIDLMLVFKDRLSGAKRDGVPRQSAMECCADGCHRLADEGMYGPSHQAGVPP